MNASVLFGFFNIRSFQYRQACTYNKIERAFGLLKARWACFRIPQQMDIEKTKQMIVAACCLHNLCCCLNMEDIGHII